MLKTEQREEARLRGVLAKYISGVWLNTWHSQHRYGDVNDWLAFLIFMSERLRHGTLTLCITVQQLMHSHMVVGCAVSIDIPYMAWYSKAQMTDIILRIR